MDALPVAALIVGSTGAVVGINGDARRLLEAADTSLQGLPAVESVFAETDQTVAGRLLSAVLQGGSWSGELRVQGRDDEPTTLSVSLTPLTDEDGRPGALAVFEAPLGSTEREQRLTRLAEVGNELLSAGTLEAVTRIVVGHLADAAGATTASLSLPIDDGRLQLLGVRGAQPGAFERWRTFDASGTPAGDCLLSARPLVLMGAKEIEAGYPEIETAAAGERTLVCLPLVTGPRVNGVISLSFPVERPFVEAELEFFRVMSDTCAQAIDRVRAQSSASDRAAKLQFLADATAELASSLDYEATLTNVTHLAVPWFADWCSIALSLDGELHTLAVAHADPEKIALAREFEERWPVDRDAPQGAYHVLRTGVSELAPELSDEMLEELVPDDEQRAMVHRLNIRGGMSVPLKVGNRVLGS